MDADIITTATDDFEKALPGYIPGLFDGSGVFKEGQENRFGGIVPRSVLFDVSLGMLMRAHIEMRRARRVEWHGERRTTVALGMRGNDRRV